VSLDERALLAAIRAGRQDGFDELARRHASAVRALLRRMGCEAATADDLTQEAFIIAFQRLSDLRGEASFAGWVKRIAARLYLRRIKRRKGFEVGLEQAPEQAAPFSDPGLLIDLDQALRRLSEFERLGVTLCHGAGLSHGEVAEALGLPLGTVKSGIKRGLDKLRCYMDPELPRAANG
jgi:RNA polymerase sigma-70 factor (ECF subfamily)